MDSIETMKENFTCNKIDPKNPEQERAPAPTRGGQEPSTARSGEGVGL
jgi:hypothetical protein